MKQIIISCIFVCILTGCRTPCLTTQEQIQGKLDQAGVLAHSLSPHPGGGFSLALGASGLSGVSLLRGMNLVSLSIHRNPELSDLTPLQGMSLKWLWIDDTAVSDLTPLSGMPLEQLCMINTQVEDISTLAGMPLKTLYMFGSRVKDLSPLKGMSLRMLSFTPEHVTNGIDVVRSMESIRFISSRGAGSRAPAQEFWRQYDSGKYKRKERAEQTN